MTEERFDVLDCSGRRTGRTTGRDEAHRTGAWHGAFHCLILYPRNGVWQVLFQQRSRTKQIAPGLVDVSVGGHYACGEGPETAGPREIREELGLSVSYADLVPLGRRIYVYGEAPAIREQEFQDVYLLPLPGRPEPLHLQAGEVDAVLEVELEGAIALLAGRSKGVPAEVVRCDGARGRDVLTADSFVPSVDRYYLRLLMQARRYAAGERDLLVI